MAVGELVEQMKGKAGTRATSLLELIAGVLLIAAGLALLLTLPTDGSIALGAILLIAGALIVLF
ncbi:MAG: hypothetical protein AB1402_05375 [Bacillota bacterium]|jgi:hypothetical protein